ncbi:hypothetical protein CDAR_563111 [Caerostris darwini]|uniref:SCP domain-containing protein n=1 Tax=Caerostris darwini TaxID=1538125 RepID=A0AAV4SMI0_9ARAC|nr:hypothetical protein CDAR_563111 [Caerostris darwini]
MLTIFVVVSLCVLNCVSSDEVSSSEVISGEVISGEVITGEVSSGKVPSSQACPYTRWSLKHSYCLEKNTGCNIQKSGLTDKEVQQILKEHNEYRNKVATGKEGRAIDGALPQAANMLQMVWDDELAGVAQKWADNCVYAHDCRDCRRVDYFKVGQNIAYDDWLCNDQKCMDNLSEKDRSPNWTSVIKNFYEEVRDSDKKLVQAFYSAKKIGHFTQIAWAKTWRIGCGYTGFVNGLSFRRFYVCNYGPAGNILNEPMYKTGDSCSDCPINSCCGQNCTQEAEFPGLCKMNDPNKAPSYPDNIDNALFHCDGESKNSDCNAEIEGTNRWATIETLIGSVITTVLEEGESATARFKKKISPHGGKFCVQTLLRKGPTVAGKQDRSHLRAEFKMENSDPVTIDMDDAQENFSPYDLNLSWEAETEFSLTFSVGKNSGAHILEIKDILAYDGECRKE